MHEDHIAAGAVEQFGQNLIGRRGAILTKDTLIGNAAGDLHSCIRGDLAKDLVEAGVVGCDGEFAVGVGYLGSRRRALRRSERSFRRRWRCRLGRGECR